MTLYDTIGKNYAQTRKSDPRIVAKLLEILAPSLASTIVDVGTGTGSYALALAEQGYRVLAVEPSATMRSQANTHPAIKWSNGYAENIPLPNQSADAAIIILAFHHFQDYQQALREIYRIIGNGQIVLFTQDPAMISRFWLVKYFPSFIQDVESTFLPISQLTAEIQAIMETVVNVIPFPLPHDLSDSFAAVGWARPELYFDSNIRDGISSFTKLDADELRDGLSRLQEDLQRGVWDKKYGHLRQQKQYDAGYCFIHSIAAYSTSDSK